MSHTSKLALISALLLLFTAGAMGAAKKPISPKQELDFGVKMAQRGLWAEALFRFQQAEKMGDTRSAVYNNIAVAYEALGLFDEAQDYYKKALDTDPRNAPLRRNYSRFVEFYQSFRTDEGGGDEASDDEEGGSAVTEDESVASGTTGSS